MKPFQYLIPFVISLFVSVWSACEFDKFDEMLTEPTFEVDFDCGGTLENPSHIYYPEISIRWTTIEGAEFYEIVLNDSPILNAGGSQAKFTAQDATHGIILSLEETSTYQQLAYNTPYKLEIRGVNDFQYLPAVTECYFMMMNPTPNIISPTETLCGDAAIPFSFTAPVGVDYTLTLFQDDENGEQVMAPFTSTDFKKTDETRTLDVTLDAGTYYFIVESKTYGVMDAGTIQVDKPAIKPIHMANDSNLCTNQPISLSWEQENFGDYEIQVDTGEGYATDGLTIDSDGAVWERNVNGQVFWRVRHSNGVCAVSEWSEQDFFVYYPAEDPIGLFEETSPHCTDDPIDLYWNGLEYGDYTIEVDTDSSAAESWDSSIVNILSNSHGQFTLPTDWEGDYQWRIMHETNCSYTEWVVQPFEVFKSPSAPSNVTLNPDKASYDATDTGVVFEWTHTYTGVGGAYELFIETEPETSIAIATNTSSDPFDIEPTWAGTYNYRIRHQSDACGFSDWVTGSFDVNCPAYGNPNLTGETTICEGTDAVINWTDTADQTYIVDFYDGSSWETIIDDLAVDTATKTSLPPGSGYQWRIKANYFNCSSDWLDTSGTFNIDENPTQTAPIGLVNPSGGAEPYSDTLQWDHTAAHPTGYEVELRTGSCTGTLVAGWPKTETTNSISTGSLSPGSDTTYYWRVRTKANGTCSEGAWSDCENFTVSTCVETSTDVPSLTSTPSDSDCTPYDPGNLVWDHITSHPNGYNIAIYYQAGDTPPGCTGSTVTSWPKTTTSNSIALGSFDPVEETSYSVCLHAQAASCGGSTGSEARIDFTVSKPNVISTTEIIISEYVEVSSGADNAKYIELYNGTSSDIDLSTEPYSLQLFRTNSSCNDSDDENNFEALVGTIPAKGTFVLCRGGTDVPAGGCDQTIGGSGTGPLSFNGDDAVVLMKGATSYQYSESNSYIIDVIGLRSCPKWGEDKRFFRKDTILVGNTNYEDPNTNGEWDVASDVGTGNLGVHPNSTVGTGAFTISGLGDDLSNLPSGSGPTDDFVVTFSRNATNVVSGTTATLSCSQGSASIASITGSGDTRTVNLAGLDDEDTCTVSFTTAITDMCGNTLDTIFTKDIHVQGVVSGAADLFISEVHETGSEKWFELHNTTGASVNLSGYEVKLYSNGNTSPGSTLSFSSGVIANGESYIVYATGDDNAAFTCGKYETGGVTGFNGNDVLELYNGTTLIDTFGTVGDGSYFYDDKSVRRNPGNGPNTTYNAADWDFTTSAPDYSDACSHTY